MSLFDSERVDVCGEQDGGGAMIRTSLECASLKIGTYMVHGDQSNEPVIMTSLGIRLIMPHCKEPGKMVALHLQRREIVKLVVHYGKQFPVIFLYATPSCAAYVRKLLGMENVLVGAANSNQQQQQQQHSKTPYYNPIHHLEYVKRIMIVAKQLRPENKAIIKAIFPLANYDEVPYKTAQDLCYLSRVPTMPLAAAKGITSTSTTADAGAVDSVSGNGSDQPTANAVHRLLIYPEGKGGISINTEDYMCLATDQYLNDAVIDVYLQYIFRERMSPDLRRRVHICSSFLYNRLTATSARQRLEERSLNMTPAQKRHNRIRTWTKKVNLFEKDYIVIPINEMSHWFLVVICFPGLKQPQMMATGKPVTTAALLEAAMAESATKRKEALAASASRSTTNTTTKGMSDKPSNSGGQQQAVTIGNTTITPVSGKRSGGAAEQNNFYVNEDTLSERDEAEGDESDLTTEEETEDTNSKSKFAPDAIKQPCILIFDSLAGSFRSRVVATLRDYLTCEYACKMKDSEPRVFTKHNMPGHNVKVPQQNNFTDCGLFLLEYVERLAAEPIRDFRLPIKALRNWFDVQSMAGKREQIGMLLRDMITREHPERVALLPSINFPTINGVPIDGLDDMDEHSDGEADGDDDEDEDPIGEKAGVDEEEEDDHFEEVENSLVPQSDEDEEEGEEERKLSSGAVSKITNTVVESSPSATKTAAAIMINEELDEVVPATPPNAASSSAEKNSSAKARRGRPQTKRKQPVVADSRSTSTGSVVVARKSARMS